MSNQEQLPASEKAAENFLSDEEEKNFDSSRVAFLGQKTEMIAINDSP